MQLVDHQIRAAIETGALGVTPYDPRLVQPASIDVRLGPVFHRMVATDHALDPSAPGGRARWDTMDLDPGRRLRVGAGPDEHRPPSGKYRLRAGQFVLAATQERIRIPPDLVGRIEGKSSIGRLGLSVHTTAGFIDPGFDGNITLELHLTNREDILLRPGMPIAQLTLVRAAGIPDRPYGHPELGSHYQHQTGATVPVTDGLRPLTPMEVS